MTALRSAAIVFVALAALPASGARAQGTSTPSTAAAPAGARDPGDPEAAVPAVTYASAFRRYRPNAEAEVGPWRDLNDSVGRIGGWRIYGREASPEAVVPNTPPGIGTPQGAPSAPAPTHGHKH